MNTQVLSSQRFENIFSLISKKNLKLLVEAFIKNSIKIKIQDNPTKSKDKKNQKSKNIKIQNEEKANVKINPFFKKL